MTIGEENFQKLVEEVRAAGFDVHPVNAPIMYLSVAVTDSKVNWESARIVFAKLNAANILVGIGSSLRTSLWEGINNGTIKLHDFGFRGRK